MNPQDIEHRPGRGVPVALVERLKNILAQSRDFIPTRISCGPIVAGRREMLAVTYQQDPPSLRPTNSASASPGRITLPATGPQPASQVGPTADPLAAHRIVKSQPLNLAEFNQLTHEERNAYIRNGHSLRDE